jgi:hypothetical protein
LESADEIHPEAARAAGGNFKNQEAGSVLLSSQHKARRWWKLKAKKGGQQETRNNIMELKR